MGGLGSAWLVDRYGTAALSSLPFSFLFLSCCVVSSWLPGCLVARPGCSSWLLVLVARPGCLVARPGCLVSWSPGLLVVLVSWLCFFLK